MLEPLHLIAERELIYDDANLAYERYLEKLVGSYETNVSTESYSTAIENVSTVFERHCGHMKFDAHLAKKVNTFQVKFANKNEDHMAFFGGNLTGVHIVRFTTADTDAWFTDILEVDELSLEEDLHALPGINPEFSVSSNVFNHSCCWMIHKFLTSPLINDKVKHQAMIDCGLVLYYKHLTSLLFRYFKHPANPQTAAATYAQLSYKFELKQHGSWYATLVSRCEKLIEPGSLHYNTLKKYDDDLAIVYLLNDSQGRIREALKNIYSIFMEVHSKGTKIKVVSNMAEYEGEETLKDNTKGLSNYTRYLHSIISDEHTFIKDELIGLIERIMKTMPAKLLKQTLSWCSTNYRHVNAKEIEELIDVTLVHSFSYLNDNRTTVKETTDLAMLISKLKGVYMSSRSSDPELMLMRDRARSVVKHATTTKNESLIASIRTGLLLYITLRAFTMNHYGSNKAISI